MQLFKGYVKTKDKRAADKFKNSRLRAGVRPRGYLEKMLDSAVLEDPR